LCGDIVIYGFGVDALEPTGVDGLDAIAFAIGGVDVVASATNGGRSMS